MSQSELHPSINIGTVKKMQPKIDDNFLTEGSPSFVSAKRRKSKIYSTRKTNEEIIKESHQDLIRYIDFVDVRVQDIVHSHEAQFLTAYKRHIKKVREEMQEIRKQSLSNASSEKAYLEKIDCLEKELIIFRNESLKLFDKICSKDKEIFDLNVRIKELQGDNHNFQKNIYFLTKRNKELQALATRVKVTMGENILANQLGFHKRESKSQNKRYEISTPKSKDIKPFTTEKKEDGEKRPFTSGKSSNGSTFYLKVQSNKKSDFEIQMSKIKEKLEEQMGTSKMISVDTVLKIIQEKQGNEAKNKSPSNTSTNPRFISKQKQKQKLSYMVIENEIMKLKSQQFADKNQYLRIFKNCVEEIKKDIIRRNNIPSLNFFKENGPKSYIQFKKMDYYAILEMMLRNEEILKKVYELLFNQ